MAGANLMQKIIIALLILAFVLAVCVAVMSDKASEIGFRIWLWWEEKREERENNGKTD